MKTEILFILDRSGSMQHLTQDTIGGYNAFLEQQKKEEGEARITTILFDDKYEVLHDRVDIKEVKPLTSDEYYARGMTALIDAIGKSVNELKSTIKKEDEKPDNVIVVITTDGQENSSTEYKAEDVRKMIKKLQEKKGWQFIFLGANIDAVKTAEMYGIDKKLAKNYTASQVGTATLYTEMSKVVSKSRAGLTLDASDLDDIV